MRSWRTRASDPELSPTVRSRCQRTFGLFNLREIYNFASLRAVAGGARHSSDLAPTPR